MAYTLQRHDEIKTGVFRIEGDIDLAVVPDLREAFEAALSSGVTNVVLDMSGVSYADSSALALIVWLDRQLSDQGGKIILSGANRDVSRILEISGLVAVAESVTSSENVAEALVGLEGFRRSDVLLWSQDLTMASSVEHLAATREQVCTLLEPLAFSDAALFDIKVALGETLANAVRHGSVSEEAIVKIRVEAYEDRVVIVVEDSGCGFDGDHACDADLYASGGRGVMFMRALMDSVEFARASETGTIVTLVKHRMATD